MLVFVEVVVGDGIGVSWGDISCDGGGVWQ